MNLYSPLFLNGAQMLARADLLFTFCGTCQRQLTWRPMGGMTFRATCCNKIYDSLPASLDFSFFQIITQDAKMENVRILKRGNNG